MPSPSAPSITLRQQQAIEAAWLRALAASGRR